MLGAVEELRTGQQFCIDCNSLLGKFIKPRFSHQPQTQTSTNPGLKNQRFIKKSLVDDRNRIPMVAFAVPFPTSTVKQSPRASIELQLPIPHKFQPVLCRQKRRPGGMEALCRGRRCMRGPQAVYRTPNRIVSHITLCLPLFVNVTNLKCRRLCNYK